MHIFVALMVAITSITVAQANVTYNVEGVFFEPNAYNTVFTGTFDWDSDTNTLSNLTGVMNSSMFFVEDDQNLTLDNNLITSMSGSIVTSSIFLNTSSVVFATGGYDASVVGVVGDIFTWGGVAPSLNPQNAYFTFSFDTAAGVLTPTEIGSTMQYGDCTSAGMMGPFCMTAFGDSISELGEPLVGEGTMSGFSSSLTISAVPVPAAVWLFGSALLGILGVSRKRTLSV